jgi:hypothetical protein
MTKYLNDAVIDIYPRRKWEYNGYKFECTGIESYLYQKSYKIMITDNNGRLHTLRHRSSRLRLSEMYNKFVKYCEL